MKPKFTIPICEHCEIRSQSIFRNLDTNNLENISLHKGCSFYKAGQVIFNEGNYPMGVFCINRGKVKVYKLGKQGKEQIVRLAKEGDTLGYRAVVTGEPYAASASALEDAVICCIPKNEIYSLLQLNSSFSLELIKLLCHDINLAQQQTVSLAQKPVRERLAETLLMLEKFYGLEDDQATIKGSMTRENLADVVGTATETVIRLLSKFKQENIIDLNQRKIKILNRKKLLSIAHLYD